MKRIILYSSENTFFFKNIYISQKEENLYILLKYAIFMWKKKQTNTKKFPFLQIEKSQLFTAD